ncbi:MAG: hypothetical protein ACLFUB_05390 [Cyclobacteriaceae bacterium]
MKTILTILTLAIVSLAPAMAQDQVHRRLTAEERADRMVARLTKELDLSEEQQQSVRALHLQHMEATRTKMEEVTKLEERRRIRQEHQEAMHRDLASILTEEQLQKLDEMKEGRHKKRKAKKHRQGKQE